MRKRHDKLESKRAVLDYSEQYTTKLVWLEVQGLSPRPAVGEFTCDGILLEGGNRAYLSLQHWEKLEKIRSSRHRTCRLPAWLASELWRIYREGVLAGAEEVKGHLRKTLKLGYGS